LTALPASPGVAGSGGKTASGDREGVLNVNLKSSSEFELESRLPDVTSYTYAIISKGYFDENGTFQGETLTLPDTFVLQARGSENTTLEIHVIDKDGNVAKFRLNLLPIEQYFTLDLTASRIIPAIKPTEVAQIIFIQDRYATAGRDSSLVQIKTEGLDFSAVEPPPEFQLVKDFLMQQGASYFKPGAGVDPVTHFPYDSAIYDAQNDTGIIEASAKFTQPTSIGFQLQILAEVANLKINNGMTPDQALTEMNTVVDNLLDAQQRFGWNGLIPWLDLDPYRARPDDFGEVWVALGDNANLAQSLAVMIGTLEMANLDTFQQSLANGIISKAEAFLDNQQLGYEKMVDPMFGKFAATVNVRTGVYNGFMDRLANEFRGAIAFLKARYPSLPDSVWDKLVPVFKDYTDRHGNVIENLAPFDGGAFQLTWPSLRNGENDFEGFRNALYNSLVTQADHAYQRHLPGFVAASQRPDLKPEGDYYGRMGMTEMAELPAADLITDVGSTYALASAYALNPDFVMTWLTSIMRQMPEMAGVYGLLDAARSRTEIAGRFLAIDVASTVLGLSGTEPDSFDTYLKNRELELAYNRLYDRMSQLIDIAKTEVLPAPAPEIPDTSLAVFSQYTAHGVIDDYPYDTTDITGARFLNGQLQDIGGNWWKIPSYDAQTNQVEIVYSATDTPGSIKLELKNTSDQAVYSTTIALEEGAERRRIVIDLPNSSKLSNIGFVLVCIDQNVTKDYSADFMIHSINFRSLLSMQTLLPDSSLTATDVTTLPGLPPAQVLSTNPADSLTQPSSDVRRLQWSELDMMTKYSAISVNFNPLNNGGKADLSGFQSLVFGLSSDHAKYVKVEIEDAAGSKAIFYALEVDPAKRYYELLLDNSQLNQGINLKAVKRINFVVTMDMADPATQSGYLDLELKGLKLL
jgi:hypothetical protein